MEGRGRGRGRGGGRREGGTNNHVVESHSKGEGARGTAISIL